MFSELDSNQQLFRTLFSNLCRTRTVANMLGRPCCPRRGGAIYVYRFGGNLDRTVLRGSWSEIRTARIYITDGLATQHEISSLLPKLLCSGGSVAIS